MFRFLIVFSSSYIDLKRRNSDPATQVLNKVESSRPAEAVITNPRKPPVSHSPSYELLIWKGTTMFTIAGHRFRKISRFSKEDRCTYCSNPMDAVVTQGHKCSGNFIFSLCTLRIFLQMNTSLLNFPSRFSKRTPEIIFVINVLIYTMYKYENFRL